MVSEALGQEPVKKTTLNAEFAEPAEESSDFLCDLSGLSGSTWFMLRTDRERTLTHRMEGQP